MQFRDNDLRAVTPSKQVNASIIHRLEIEQGRGRPGTIYSVIGLEALNSACEDLVLYIHLCLT